MSAMDKKKPGTAPAEEKPIESDDCPEAPEVRKKKAAKPRQDRSGKFCYQPGELRIVRKGEA